MRIADALRDLWELSGYRPQSFWRAMAVSFLWTILLYVFFALLNLVIELVRFAVGLSDLRALYPDPNFGVIWFLPLLPLLWIAVSRNVNIALSFLGLAALWALAFRPKRFMNMPLSDGELIELAGMYLFVWAGNQFSCYRARRRAQSDPGP